jgi:hypothetical protein
MNTLFDEIDELLSRAKYLEGKHSKTIMAPDYWVRLKSVCDRARQALPDLLRNVAPDDSQKTWAEALLCLETIDEALRDSKTSSIPGHY